MLQDVARCCKMLQDVARCCKMLQDVARCCKMLQVVMSCPLSRSVFVCLWRMWSRQYQPLPANLQGLSAPTQWTGRNKSNIKMYGSDVETLAPSWKSRKWRHWIGLESASLFTTACCTSRRTLSWLHFRTVLESIPSKEQKNLTSLNKRHFPWVYPGFIHALSITLPPSHPPRRRRLRLQRRFEFSQRAAVQNWWSWSWKPLAILAQSRWSQNASAYSCLFRSYIYIYMYTYKNDIIIDSIWSQEDLRRSFHMVIHWFLEIRTMSSICSVKCSIARSLYVLLLWQQGKHPFQRGFKKVAARCSTPFSSIFHRKSGGFVGGSPKIIHL